MKHAIKETNPSTMWAEYDALVARLDAIGRRVDRIKVRVGYGFSSYANLWVWDKPIQREGWEL